MSKTTDASRITTKDIRNRKNNTPIVCLTAYTTPIAKILDDHCDLLLVGDSLGMVVYGMDSTLGVTVDMMINHGQAVMRGTQKAHITVDLPFGSYQKSKEQAFETAARIMAETGCSSVKLEGGREMAETIEFLCNRGVPVMGHIGLLPQSFHQQGGFRAHGRNEKETLKILDDAKAIADAGAFATVIEGVVEPLAKTITENIDIPTIGIGASPACDGQILVSEDMLGLFQDFTPKFVKQYENLAEMISTACASYAQDVRQRRFPEEAHIFKVKGDKKKAINDG